MKTYKEFIKEASYSVYGQATFGSTPGRASDQQIKSGVDRAIKNVGTGKGSGQIGQRGKFGLTGGVNVSMTASSGRTTPTKTTPTKTKTTPTKTTPTKTKTTPTKTTPTKITPTTTRTTPTNTPTKPSGGSTPIKPTPIRPIRPIRPIANNSNRSSGGSTNILQKGSM